MGYLEHSIEKKVFVYTSKNGGVLRKTFEEEVSNRLELANKLNLFIFASCLI